MRLARRPCGEPVAVRLERPRDEGAEAAQSRPGARGSRRMCSTRSSSVSTWPYIIVAVVDMPSRCASRMTPSHSSVVVFFGAMIVADAVDEDLGAAAGERVEPGVAQPRERLRDRQLRAARDVLHLGRRERVQVDRVALLDRAEEILVEVDPEVRGGGRPASAAPVPPSASVSSIFLKMTGFGSR